MASIYQQLQSYDGCVVEGGDNYKMERVMSGSPWQVYRLHHHEFGRGFWHGLGPVLATHATLARDFPRWLESQS